MRRYFAPMEGITGWLFRSVHQRYFPGADKYYMPFLSPRRDHSFTQRELADVLPEHNGGAAAVPQLLTGNGEDFLWAARELFAMGYREINLNLGCPSGTVTAKGKGAGLLGRPQELERMLDTVFSAAPTAISVKTRLGLERPEEFGPLLELFNRYPIAELTIHPRVRRDFYKGRPRMEAFAAAAAAGCRPICYNGDLTTPESVSAFSSAFPAVEAVMIGRGAVADPAVFRKCAGGAGASAEELRGFHDELYEGYCRAFDSRRNAMLRMKEVWSYLIGLFEDGGRWAKALRKERVPAQYERLTAELFRSVPLRVRPREVWRQEGKL